MDLENMALWARYKGIHLLGTGDFTHPSWFQELQEKLRPAEAGLFCLREDLRSTADPPKPGLHAPTKCVLCLSAEIAQTFLHNGDLQRIRHLIFAPDFGAVKRIRAELGRFGDLQAEGRPTLHLDIPDTPFDPSRRPPSSASDPGPYPRLLVFASWPSFGFFRCEILFWALSRSDLCP